MKSFTLDGLQKKYGIRRGVITELMRGGFIEPARGKRREYRFSFHDLVLMRMAQDLHGAGISARKLTRFLKDLARALPETPVAGMRVSAAGRELVVRHDGRLRNLQGQLMLDFTEAASGAAQATPLAPPARRPQRLTAEEHFARAEALVETDAAAAADHYRQAVELAPQLRDAWVNLSCLLLDAGQAIEALAICQEGLLAHPDAALLHYNLGIALEEMQEPEAALAAYGEALRCDPALADAHFNAARMADLLGRKAIAIRHYSAYRRSGHH